MQRNSFYRNELIYKGWKVMIIKPGTGSLVMVNYWPALNLDKVKEIEITNKALHDAIMSVFSKNMGSFRLNASGRNPNFDYVLIDAKNHIDWNLGEFDLNRKLQSA
jgi:hypothetical protein